MLSRGCERLISAISGLSDERDLLSRRWKPGKFSCDREQNEGPLQHYCTGTLKSRLSLGLCNSIDQLDHGHIFGGFCDGDPCLTPPRLISNGYPGQNAGGWLLHTPGRIVSPSKKNHQCNMALTPFGTKSTLRHMTQPMTESFCMLRVAEQIMNLGACVEEAELCWC